VSKFADIHQRIEKQVDISQIRQKSDDTFSWVALVIEELQGDVLECDINVVPEEIPTGLIPLYRMMTQIQQLRRRNLQRCLLALSTATLTYRPLHLLEMLVIVSNTPNRPQETYLYD
jgi:hypothetical protein